MLFITFHVFGSCFRTLSILFQILCGTVEMCVCVEDGFVSLFLISSLTFG